MKINKNHIEFLKEYEKLCKKYNMGLHGCGCCESPHLIDCNGEKWDYVEYLENINFNENGELTIKPFMGLEETLDNFIKNNLEKEVEEMNEYLEDGLNSLKNISEGALPPEVYYLSAKAVLEHINNLQSKIDRANEMLNGLLKEAYYNGEYIQYDYSTNDLLELKDILKEEICI